MSHKEKVKTAWKNYVIVTLGVLAAMYIYKHMDAFGSALLFDIKFYATHFGGPMMLCGLESISTCLDWSMWFTGWLAGASIASCVIICIVVLLFNMEIISKIKKIYKRRSQKATIYSIGHLMVYSSGRS